MKSLLTALALAGAAVAESCSKSRDGTFNIQPTNVTSSSTKRNISARQADGTLTVSLKDGVLTDQAGRTGNVVANHQFQFDKPIQHGSLYKDGFAICENGTLTHQGSAIWYHCLSGSFYNLYDQSQGKQCNPVYFYAVPAGSGSDAKPSQKPDGQPVVSSAAPVPPKPVSQISDGQPQAPTGKPSNVISQISDGQPQAPTGVTPKPSNVISQISDGQPQAPTGTAKPSRVISQISDGQPQAPTVAPSPAPKPLISQISDGQVQAPAPTPSPPKASPKPVVSQISDGQVQAYGSSAPPQAPSAVPEIPASPQAPAAPPAITPVAPVAPAPTTLQSSLVAPVASAPAPYPAGNGTVSVAPSGNQPSEPAQQTTNAGVAKSAPIALIFGAIAMLAFF